jgi:predicted phosphohydrolase
MVNQNIVIIGASGLVGTEFVKLLRKKDPVKNFNLMLISANSVGKKCPITNLEYKSMNDIRLDYVNFFSKYNNVYLLDNSKFKLNNGLTIVGSTLWSNPLANEDNYEFRKAIYDKLRISVEEFQLLHLKSLKYLKKIIKENNKNILFMTHFPPTQNNTSNSIFNNQKQYMKDYYASEILNDFENEKRYNCLGMKIKDKKIKGWLFGHTHHSTNIIINNINLISNQLGYDYENKISNYNKDGLYEISL